MLGTASLAGMVCPHQRVTFFPWGPSDSWTVCPCHPLGSTGSFTEDMPRCGRAYGPGSVQAKRVLPHKPSVSLWTHVPDAGSPGPSKGLVPRNILASASTSALAPPTRHPTLSTHPRDLPPASVDPHAGSWPPGTSWATLAIHPAPVSHGSLSPVL